MYNRYVPQADGSYRRNRMEEQRQSQPQPQPPCHPEAPQPPCEEIEPPQQHPCQPKHQPQHVGGFLRQLLPKNFDTADLIIILLLLLLSGDCEEDKTTAMLTLVLYLFL